ncbi:hypothetical protein KRP22_005206 [Phytophthora ramorum]|nr:hypothetical protein KRP23_8227 [Phytophthora ramorum]KAH7497729.1 hypothetical protein KRP22_12790 [Phytophthora ramorum]
MLLAPYEVAARRRRSQWPESVREDPEVQELDEANGEWVLCRTCAALYDRTRRGRKPNDPKGFKVKMNGKFQTAAWAMHKSRVVAHRGASDMVTDSPEEENRRQEIEVEMEARRSVAKKRRVTNRAEQLLAQDAADVKLIHLPRTGWRCPGVVPDVFYRENAELVHAFAKYHVGGYRVNVVRDLRSDKVMLFSHDCENQVVHRERPGQSDSCESCYSVWLHNKSFKRILKKMDRYALVEDILRHSWSMSTEELSVLSKFKHSSDMNLNLEGRKLKQAAMVAVQHFNGSAKTLLIRSGSNRPSGGSTRSERFERAQQPLSMEVMLQLQSFDSSMHEEGANAASESLQQHGGNMQQPTSPNGYLIQQGTPATQVDERIPESRDQ